MTVDAVILAAGYSSRADGFKMQFEIEQKAVLAYVIEAFIPVCNQIIVVGGYQYKKLIPIIKPYEEKVKLVVNKEFDQGMFSSIKTGVKEVLAEQFFITPGDYPMLTEDICKEILLAGKEYVIPSYENKGGHPILLPFSCKEELLLEETNSNLKEFLKKKPMEYIAVKSDAIIHDLDTRNDYKKLQEYMKEIR